MKVICLEEEWHPMADLESDRNMVADCLTTPIKISKRESSASMGPEYVIEVTQKEFNKYYRLTSEVKAMSAMFLYRRKEKEAKLVRKIHDL